MRKDCTRVFKTFCSFHLLQTKLVNVAESISTKLAYFTELDRVGSRLNSPALSVTSGGFLPLLTRLDECISFTEQNVRSLHFVQCLS